MIALVDSNNFFASCERLFRPDLKNRPVLVLSSNDGCVVARSQEVKDLGVAMGVPYFQIREVAEKNKIHVFSSNFALYSNISQRILQYLHQFSPRLEVYSIDEAFLDLSHLAITDYRNYGDGIQNAIQHDIGMPVSVGIAPNKTLAKLAGDWAKKHASSCVIDPVGDSCTYQMILKAAPIGEVWGIGRRLAPQFQAIGIRTAWQLAQASEAWVRSRFSISLQKTHAELKGHLCFPFEAEREAQKSLIVSRSFGHTIGALHELETAIASFASSAAYKLRSHEQKARLFGVFARYKDEEGIVRNTSLYTKLSVPTNDTAALVATALALLEKLYKPNHGYKKCGVFAYHLSSADKEQTVLFDTKRSRDLAKKRQQLMQAVDEITHRFGADSIHVGVINPNDTDWYVKSEKRSPLYTTDWNQLPKVYADNA